MEFTNEEIKLLVDLLKDEQKKHKKGKVYYSPQRQQRTASAYQKLLQLLAVSNKQHLQENGHHCDRCQCATPENELDINNGICNECVVAERELGWG